jgi:ribonuclease J
MPGPRLDRPVARPTVTFLGGVREIGGNKILIDDGGDRVLFDFGRSFSERYDDYYVNFLQPRSTSYLKDLLEFDLLPRAPGLYSEEALAGTDLRYEAPRIGAVFVSHPHMDHVEYLELLDPKVPLHLGRTTRSVLEVMETTTQGFRAGDAERRVWTDRRGVRVGGLEVVPFPVDHSVPGAYGFLVHTSEGCLVYTGDFRQHGPRAADTEAFLEAARREKPIALLTEGTRMGPDLRLNYSEAQVRGEVGELLRSSERLALTTCYPRDLDRLTSLYQAARESGRDFIVSFKSARLLEQMAEHHLPGVPVPGRSPGLEVYLRPKKVYKKWEQPFLDHAVDATQVTRRGRQALLQLDLAQFPEMIDVRPPRGSPFIHSMSEPFSEEDVNHDVLLNWLEHFGLGYHQLHASGHCSGPELLDLVRTMEPESVFPIHTEHPDGFERAGRPVVLVEPGATYALPGGARVPSR